MPEKGRDLSVEAVPGGVCALPFEPGDAEASRSGNDLVFKINDGTATITNYFATGDTGRLPTFSLPDGTLVALDEALPDIGTAASASGARGSGANDYNDDPGALVDAVDRLGKLGTDHWGRSAERPEYYDGVPGGDDGGQQPVSGTADTPPVPDSSDTPEPPRPGPPQPEPPQPEPKPEPPVPEPPKPDPEPEPKPEPPAPEPPKPEPEPEPKPEPPQPEPVPPAPDPEPEPKPEPPTPEPPKPEPEPVPPLAADDAGVVHEHGRQTIRGSLTDNDMIPEGKGGVSEASGIGPGIRDASGNIVVTGRYGRLTIHDDGSYDYDVDGDNLAVQTLYASNVPGSESLSDTFTYTLTGDGGSDAAELKIDIIPDKLLIGTSGDDGSDRLDGGVGSDVLVADPGGVGFTTSYPDYNLAVIMDTSGSMKDNGFEAAKLALAGLVTQYANYEGRVNLSIIGFANGVSYNFADNDLNAEDMQTWTDGKHNNSIGTLKIGDALVTVGVDGKGNLIADNTAFSFRFNDDILEYRSGAAGGWTPAKGMTWTGGDMVAKVLGMQAADGTNYEAALNTANAWYAAQTADPAYAGYKNTAYFITDGEPTHYYRDYTTADGVTLSAPPSYAGVYNRYATGGTSNTDFRYPEVYFDKGGEILPDASGAAYRINDAGIFQKITQGGKWSDLPGTKSVYAGSGWEAGDAEYGNSRDAYDSLLKSLDGKIDVNVIGINIGGQALEFLHQLDNTGGAQSISSAGDLQAALAAASPIADPEGVGNDSVDAGAGGDALIFGDAVNADFLLDPDHDWFKGEGHAAWTPGSDLSDGSSLSIVQAYLAQTLHSGDAQAVLPDEIRDFIRDNAELLGQSDTVTGPDGLPRGGSDLLRGGDGNDTVFGQGGDDTIYGGAGDDVLHGGTGNDLIYGGAGNDTIYGDAGNDTIFGGEGRNVIHTGDGDNVVHLGDGSNVVHIGEGENVIFGGGGQDVFVMEHEPVQSGKTVIQDFAGGDVVDFRNLDGMDSLISRLQRVDGVDEEHHAIVFESHYNNIHFQAMFGGDQLTLVLTEGLNSRSVEIHADSGYTGFEIDPYAEGGEVAGLLHQVVACGGEDHMIYDMPTDYTLNDGSADTVLAGAASSAADALDDSRLSHRVIDDFSGGDVLDFKQGEDLEGLLSNLRKVESGDDGNAFAAQDGDVGLKAVFSEDRLVLTLSNSADDSAGRTVEIHSDPLYTGLDNGQDFDTEAAVKFLQSITQQGG
jgi:VCBS repeat-containing protein